MKKISKLRLNLLNEQDLEDKQMNSLKGGGGECFCSCYYANSGGSTSSANRSANANYGYYSGSGCNQYSQAGNYIGYCSNCMA
jgi:natural product precursor